MFSKFFSNFKVPFLAVGIPSLKILSPTDGTEIKIGQPIGFKGTAAKPIVKVKLLAEDTHLLGEVKINNGSWSVNTLFSQAGKRQIVAKGFDAANKQVSANAVNISIVGASAAPSLKITSPANSAEIKVGQSIGFKGTADKSIVKVKLLADETYPMGEAGISNGSWSINTLFSQAGKRQVIVKGFDAANKQVSANAVDVFIVGSTGGIITGIDIYSGTGSIDWQAVKNANISFAFVKATEGMNFVDEAFSVNWEQMRKAGMIRGAYHFFRPAKDPAAQAQNFLQTINELEIGDLPPVLDAEYTPNPDEWSNFDLTTRIARVKQWLDIVEQKTGRKSIIYTAPNFWNDTMGNSHAFTDYPLWIANYGVSEPTVPADNWGGKGWKLWQISDSGSVDGISNNVDTNRFNGSFDQLVALAKGTSIA